ncbi:MaoC/PaaZ C-terminal domain-containing protein [Actinoplanes sp. NPDC051851]|uniref:MaoC family dehydratase n=1 Tax=Actinoplanes sp. NPDC051851 TaxID=3154753 RepID=UPI00343244B8
MVAVVEISEGPGTGAAYAKAALGLIPGLRKGDSLPDVELVHRGVTVDLGHLARYDRVCGFRLGGVLPATYPHILAFPLAMRLMSAGDFPLPMIGLVHVSNRITVHEPVDAGTPLDLSVRAVDLREHPRGRQFDVIATATVSGREVWRGVSTYLRKETSGYSPRHQQADPPPPGGAVWRLPVRTGPDYAAVSGDRNPIHTSKLGAKLFGFPKPIAHGMWTKARCLAALEGRLPEAYTVDVAFKQPITLPSTVRFLATPTGTGWDFTVNGKKPHLTGSIGNPPA